jgi:UDP-GlcNAc:undecaprenyl-phosphate GlcNAc-1-phosphate transferase
MDWPGIRHRLGLTMNFIVNGQPAEALMMAVFAAGLLGFLVYNSNPASIFMGDCGSPSSVFFASAALVNLTGGRSRSFRRSW